MERDIKNWQQAGMSSDMWNIPEKSGLYAYEKSDTETVIYIGKSDNLKRRAREHLHEEKRLRECIKNEKPNIIYRYCPLELTDEEIRQYEKEMISRYNPEFNYQHNDQYSIRKEAGKMDIVEKPNNEIKDIHVCEFLDNLRGSGERFLAFKIDMGCNHSYNSKVSLRWFGEKVNFVSDLEMFQGHLDEHGNILIDKDTILLITQRKPDWSRQEPLTRYLTASTLKDDRKFPPVLLVAYQDWVSDQKSKKWDENRRAIEDSVTLNSLDSKGVFVEFDHTETKFYALDGQHRLMGVKGIINLLHGGILAKKTKKGKLNPKTFFELKDFIPENMSENAFKRSLHSMMNDEIGVEIIPMVQKGETFEDAMKRVRKIFVDVNKYAKSLTKAELSLLDDGDIYGVVARQIMNNHLLFYNEEGDSLVLKEGSGNINKNDVKTYTTLPTIIEITKSYLGRIYQIDRQQILPHRNYHEYIEKMETYFDEMTTLQSHKEMLQGAPIVRDSNVLFRPVAQEALADAVGRLEKEAGFSLQTIMEKLRKREKYLEYTTPSSLFYEVIWDGKSKRMKTQKDDKNLAATVFIYILGGINEHNYDSLKDKIFDRRLPTPESDEAVNFDGMSTTKDKFDLPELL